jgi:hypothetical protein
VEGEEGQLRIRSKRKRRKRKGKVRRGEETGGGRRKQ